MELEELLDGWTVQERRIFFEVLEDAATELQRELIQRAAAARHTAAEIHAFADEIRGMTDGEIFDACTPDSSATVTVAQRLRAQVDPLYALEVNGRKLSPRFEDDPGPAYATGTNRPRPQLFRTPPALTMPVPSAFEPSSRELGSSRGDPPTPRATTSGRESRFSEAVRGLGVQLREYRVDEAGALTLEKGLELAARALAAGTPVVATLGRKAGELTRCVLMLQEKPVGSTRAFQLHDPFTGETVWANERDLLGRSELPFSAKMYRRITALTLPAAPESARLRSR